MPLEINFNKTMPPKAPTPQELVVAIDKRNVEAVRDLISRGVDIAAADKLWGNGAASFAGRGFTTLGWAAHIGAGEIVQLLVEAGADVNTKDRWGHTPLMRASIGAYMGIVKFLLKNGAGIEEKNDEGKTALDLAFKWGSREIVALLREKTDCASKHDLLRAQPRRLKIKPA